MKMIQEKTNIRMMRSSRNISRKVYEENEKVSERC